MKERYVTDGRHPAKGASILVACMVDSLGAMDID